jgi:site-specific DNA-cytosine methylase
VENVAALLVRGLDAVLGTLASFGYDAEWSCFSACSLGAPHTRDRLFIVAYTSGLMGLQGLGVGRHAKGQEALQRDLLRQRRIAWLDSLVRTSGVSDGIPRGLDSPGGRLNAHESCIAKARTAGLPGTSSLSRMRSDTRSSATSPGSSVCHICGVPLSILPYHRRPSIWEVGTWQEEAKGVHCLRRGVHELFAHQGENMREGLPVGSWQEECKQTMAHRADRIERLGNAVPPAMSEWIGRRILESVDI